MNKKIRILKNKIKKYSVDGYVIPKNDEFFSEYAAVDRLKVISNFNGSAGMAIVLQKKNYLFVDGRYTIQAKQQSGKDFEIIEIHKYLPKKILKNLVLGYDPSLFTKSQIKYYFGRSIKLKPIEKNLIDEIHVNKKIKPNIIFSLNSKIVGETTVSKINKITLFKKSQNFKN